jgi:mortality factor 4-like protein 1
MPDLLKLQLIDDWENITKDQKLVTLPRKPNVAEILEDYKKIKIDSKNNNISNDVILEMLNGIKQYFDKALGNILLYHFERQQYVQVTKDYPDQEMSSIYGAEHLLRLFVQFPQLLTQTNMDQDSMTLLKDQFTDFLEYMANNKKKMFQIEYENASPIYISLVKDS